MSFGTQRERADARNRETFMGLSMSGGLAEALCGIAVVVLAIIGLANYWPFTMAAIGEILFGIALLCAGGALVAGISGIWTEHGTEAVETRHAGWGSGMATEVVGALAGIVLGIMALVGIAPLTLIAVALLLFGGVLITGAAARGRVESLVDQGLEPSHNVHMLSREASQGVTGVHMLAGVAAIVLGLLAIIWAVRYPGSSLDLTLIGLLCLGASSIVSGLVLSGRTMRFLTR
jgi:hypothetical protein